MLIKKKSVTRNSLKEEAAIPVSEVIHNIKDSKEIPIKSTSKAQRQVYPYKTRIRNLILIHIHILIRSTSTFENS